MAYTDEDLNYIYDKNEGFCWHCGKKLSFINYGRPGEKGAWEVDHSIPVIRGGTGHLNNLVPACVRCNRSKQDLTSREY
jgi:5-methylcytosine-specific restriction endonuclease McrA